MAFDCPPSLRHCHQRPFLVLSGARSETDARHPIAYTYLRVPSGQTPSSRRAIIQCVHGSIQRLQLRRRAFHNSLFPDPHALTGPRTPPCTPSHAPSLLFCTLPASASHAALGHVPRPAAHQGRCPSKSAQGTATLTSHPHPAHLHLAAAARRYHLLPSPSVAGAGVLALPCLVLPCPTCCNELTHTPLDAYSCGAFPLSGVIPTPILACCWLAPNTSCCSSIATAYKSDPTSTHRAPPASLQSTRSHLVPFLAPRPS